MRPAPHVRREPDRYRLRIRRRLQSRARYRERSSRYRVRTRRQRRDRRRVQPHARNNPCRVRIRLRPRSSGDAAMRSRSLHGRSLAIIGVILVCIVGAFFPLETEIVPAWRLRVVDENGRAVAGQEARQSWIDHALDTTGWHEQARTTDADGYVTFPRRTVRASLLRRVAMPVINLLTHGGVGVAASVRVYNNTGDAASVAYKHGATLPESIVLPPLKKSPRGGDGMTRPGASPNNSTPDNSSLPPPPPPPSPSLPAGGNQ